MQTAIASSNWNMDHPRFGRAPSPEGEITSPRASEQAARQMTWNLLSALEQDCACAWVKARTKTGMIDIAGADRVSVLNLLIRNRQINLFIKTPDELELGIQLDADEGGAVVLSWDLHASAQPLLDRALEIASAGVPLIKPGVVDGEVRDLVHLQEIASQTLPVRIEGEARELIIQGDGTLRIEGYVFVSNTGEAASSIRLARAD